MDLIFTVKYQLVSIETLQYIQCMHYALPLSYFALLVDSLRCQFVEVWVVTGLKTKCNDAFTFSVTSYGTDLNANDK